MAIVINVNLVNKLNLKAYRCKYISNEDTNGVFYNLGTNFGSTTWSNPTSLYSTTAGTQSRYTNRDLSNFNNISSPVTFTFPSHLILIEKVVFVSTGNATNVSISIPTNEISTTIGSIALPNTSVITYYSIDIQNPIYYTNSFTFTVSSSISLYEIEVYGIIKRIDDETLANLTPATTISNFVDSRQSITGPLSYRGLLISSSDIVFPISRIVMSEDLTIPNDQTISVYNLNPNGANRNVILPQVQGENHYLRINNINGVNALQIREVVAGTIITTLSIANNLLSCEAIWDGDTWHITTS